MGDYTTEIDPQADGDLMNIWADAADQAAVTRADHEASWLLATDPVGRGERRSGGMYRMVVPPLVYVYEVDPVRRHVQVVGIGTVS